MQNAIHCDVVELHIARLIPDSPTPSQTRRSPLDSDPSTCEYRWVVPPIRLIHPAPANEQDFEELCLLLLRVHCNRPTLELYGHRGESQSGVDIFDPSGERPVIGAQCKLRGPSKSLRRAEVRDEVRKARSFTPSLDLYLIMTSAKRTAATYQAVATLNRDHTAQGLFQIQLMTWERIEQLLQQYPHVANSFYKTLAGESVSRLEDDLAAMREWMSTIGKALLTTPQSSAITAPSVDRTNPPLLRKSSKLGSFGNAADFEQESKLLLGKLDADERLAPILNGAHFPVCLPMCEIGDYGRLVDEVFLPAVKRVYEVTFAKRHFQDSMTGKLHGRLAIASESRQEKLIEKMAIGPVVGILFPLALQGYSVLAAREQMASLPKGFVLSGVLDSCVAMISYPDVLAADHAPTLVCAGTTWQAEFSLSFHPDKKYLNFGVADEAFAVGSFSPGLLYISW